MIDLNRQISLAQIAFSLVLIASAVTYLVFLRNPKKKLRAR
jgi:hypothetical protein